MTVKELIITLLEMEQDEVVMVKIGEESVLLREVETEYVFYDDDYVFLKGDK